MDLCDAYLRKMYLKHNGFVFSVTLDLGRTMQTPILVMPDDTESHAYAIAEETAMLAPKSQMTFLPWEDDPQRVALAVRQLPVFLDAHRPG